MCKNVLPHINKSFFFNVYLKLVFCQGEVYSCMLNKLDKNKKKLKSACVLVDYSPHFFLTAKVLELSTTQTDRVYCKLWWMLPF